jgi:hypothetical protein
MARAISQNLGAGILICACSEKRGGAPRNGTKGFVCRTIVSLSSTVEVGRLPGADAGNGKSRGKMDVTIDGKRKR